MQSAHAASIDTLDTQAPEERLRALGIELPPAPPAVGDYTPTVIAGNLLFMSGQLPWIAGDLKLDELMPPAAEPECDGATIHPLAPRSGWRAGGRR
jgi:hypothetical protein